MSLKTLAPYFQSRWQPDGSQENTTFVLRVQCNRSGHGDSLSYSIEHGDDQHFFELNSTSGELLSFITPKDFENPEDNNSDTMSTNYQSLFQMSIKYVSS